MSVRCPLPRDQRRLTGGERRASLAGVDTRSGRDRRRRAATAADPRLRRQRRHLATAARAPRRGGPGGGGLRPARDSEPPKPSIRAELLLPAVGRDGRRRRRASSASATAARRCIIVGNSLGGALALRAAQREDLPIAGIVPIAPAGPAHGRLVLGDRERVAGPPAADLARCRCPSGSSSRSSAGSTGASSSAIRGTADPGRRRVVRRHVAELRPEHGGARHRPPPDAGAARPVRAASGSTARCC